MPRLAANLSTLFLDAPFLERFDRAARAGFEVVEFQFAYDFGAAEIKARLGTNGLELALFNIPAGDWEHGDRGLAIHPGRREEFRRGVVQALDRAAFLGCGKVHMLAGILRPGDDLDEARLSYLEGLRFAAQSASVRGVDVMIEPISRETIPGYFLSDLDEAADLIAECGETNVFIQYDLFHRRFAGSDLVGPYRRHRDLIRHVQLAGWPGRAEPDPATIDFVGLFDALDGSGYQGTVGCEYWSAGRTEDGLGWAAPYLRRRA